MSERLSRPYTYKEVCYLLGLTKWTFARLRERLHSEEQMPRPMIALGQMKWERAGFDLWRMRHHPFAPKPPANDLVAMPPPNDDDQRAALAAEYALPGQAARR